MALEDSSPVDPESDPGPGERSGLASGIAAELLDDGLAAAEAESAPGTAAAEGRSIDTEVPEFAVGDDPEHPLHGSMAKEFEENLRGSGA